MKSLLERDAQRVWHPYTQSGFGAVPLPVVAARGSELILEDGRRVLDGISSWWCNLHGHAHPALVAAAAEQFGKLDHVLFAGVTHEPAVRLAERLCEVVPHNFDRMFYSDNGSTAIEVAIKLAVQVWQHRGERRLKVVALEDAYHGDTFGAMAAGARGIFSAPFDEMLFSVERISIRGDARDLERVEELCRGGEVACFLFEPLVQGAGGMRMYDASVLDAYCEVFQRHGVLCIADEVMTGFGRTGELFACAAMKRAPELVCLSKGITSGTLPLAVTMCREALFREFVSPDHSRTFFHGHTFTANPIACAVALRSLDILLSDESIANRTRIAASHERFIESLARVETAQAPRARGTICAFDAVSSSGTGYSSAIAQRAREFFIERGVLLRPLGNVVYCMPPYCYTDAELQRTYEAMYDFAGAAGQ